MPLSKLDGISLSTVVEDSTLVAITQFELSACRAEHPEPIDDSVGAEPSYGLQIEYRDDGDGFRVRLEIRFDTSVGTVVSNVGAEYRLEEIRARDISHAVLLDFVNNVAVMALVPYMRQSIADISLKVFESALLMPMVQRGAIEFTVDEPE